MEMIKGDITKIQTDILVNAANGIGYMGGWIGRKIKLNGVAESIHFATNGTIEKKAKAEIRERRIKTGDIYVTDADTLPAK